MDRSYWDSFQEVALNLLLEVDKLVVDPRAYVSYRAPEIVELVQAGRLSAEDAHAEWPDIVAGQAAGRESEDEIILYVAVGIWGEYAAILAAVFWRARELGLGTRTGVSQR